MRSDLALTRCAPLDDFIVEYIQRVQIFLNLFIQWAQLLSRNTQRYSAILIL